MRKKREYAVVSLIMLFLFFIILAISPQRVISQITRLFSPAVAYVAFCGEICVTDYPTLNAAITDLGGTPVTLVVPNTQTLTANLIVPSTMKLKILNGGSIIKAGAFTVAINGPFEAGLYQVFSGFSDGDITFGYKAIKDVYPQWWGAVGDDNTDCTNALNFASSAASSVNIAGTIINLIIPPGTYKITSQVAIKANVNVISYGRLKNYLAVTTTPCVAFNHDSWCESLRVDCNSRAGVLLGDAAVFNNMSIGSIILVNVGTAANQYGIKFRGYNFNFKYLEVTGGNIGVLLEGASDLKGMAILINGAVTGLEIDGCEAVDIGHVDIDTPTVLGFRIDQSHDVSIESMTIWENDGTTYDADLVDAALIGEYSIAEIVSDLRLNIHVQNTGGNGVKLNYVAHSIITVSISKGNRFTGVSHPILTGITYAIGVDSSVVVLGFIDPSIATPISGDIEGTHYTNIGMYTTSSVHTRPSIRVGGENRIGFGTAAPFTGTWSQGDVIWNTGAIAGGVPGWVCTTAGTSGTWKAMSNLAP